MNHLKEDLQLMINAGNPPMDTLLTTIRHYSDTLEKDVVTSPQRIKEIICDCFLKQLGWDIRRKLVKNTTLFQSSHVVSTLTEILHELNNWSPPVQPTNEELQDFSKACNRLWDLDVHRLVPNKDYVINVQEGKSIYDKQDSAKEPLFTFVDERIFEQMPTYAAFMSLLDNYVSSLGQSEVVTDEEKSENYRFLNLIMDTSVMQYTHSYLIQKQLTKATTRQAFVTELYQLWFGLYKRKVANDSSGFEHVFVGEIKEETNEITGLHNWIQIYMEEKKKRPSTFDYRGFIKPKRKGYSNASNNNKLNTEQFISIQFAWQNAFKSVSSSFIGVSPEFEFALYTLCFFSGQEKSIVQCGPYKVEMTCFRWNAAGKVYIATSFPSEAPLNEDEAATKIQSQFRGKNTRTGGKA